MYRWRFQLPSDGVHVCTFLEEVRNHGDTVINGCPVENSDVFIVAFVDVHSLLLYQLPTSEEGNKQTKKEKYNFWESYIKCKHHSVAVRLGVWRGWGEKRVGGEGGIG